MYRARGLDWVSPTRRARKQDGVDCAPEEGVQDVCILDAHLVAVGTLPGHEYYCTSQSLKPTKSLQLA
jgi:hypothetical protein